MSPMGKASPPGYSASSLRRVCIFLIRTCDDDKDEGWDEEGGQGRRTAKGRSKDKTKDSSTRDVSYTVVLLYSKRHRITDRIIIVEYY